MTAVSRLEDVLLIAIVVAALVWTAIGANSLGTWALEVVWVFLGAHRWCYCSGGGSR
jgi:putative membrane protein